ncbi:SDR family oxidoreductase, partial [Streptomyces sp. NPDC056730]|uniref:SDR family oxidoreductase n=1 Tax=Streptomyces sp. NPDC056730 TaxID=3345929 RepID=UPI0036C4389B
MPDPELPDPDPDEPGEPHVAASGPAPGRRPETPGPAPGPDSATPALAGSTIAVSGATGFLASYLLLHLLPQGTRVVALVRKPAHRAMASLMLALRSAGAPAETVQRVARQVRAVQIPLDRPRLGLSEGEFQTLADSVDAV